jgi:hypothetical protein
MNRFGFVLLPERGNRREFFLSNNAGWAVHSDHSDARKAPAAVWFDTAQRRDLAMNEAATTWPGNIFCPVEVTNGIKCVPGPLANYNINERGVLPR